MKKVVFGILICFVLSSFPLLNVQAATVIVSNLNFNADKLSKNKLKKLWLGKIKKLKNIGRIYIIDQNSNTESAKVFYKKIINKKPNQIRAYWSKIQFIGKGFPPKAVDNDKTVINWVLNNNNSIGYIDSKFITPKLKVLYTIEGDK